MKVLQEMRVCFFIVVLILINSFFAMNLKKTDEKISEQAGQLPIGAACKKNKECGNKRICAKDQRGNQVCQFKIKSLGDWCGEDGECFPIRNGHEVDCRKTGPGESDYYCSYLLFENSYCKWKLFGSHCRPGLKCSNNKCVKK